MRVLRFDARGTYFTRSNANTKGAVGGKIMFGRNAAKMQADRAPLSPEAAEKLRALVRALAKLAAEADYEASKTRTSSPPKGSSS